MKNNIFILIAITFLIIGSLIYDIQIKKVISERYMDQIEELQHYAEGRATNKFIAMDKFQMIKSSKNAHIQLKSTQTL